MSILIKNGLIYDGRGHPPFKKDILIRGKHIVGIGEIKKSKSEELINAEDAIVVPGFIDTSSQIDHYLQIFDNTSQEDLIGQGITTAIGGNGGSSLAPIFKDSLEEIEKRGSEPSLKMNINWENFYSFFKVLKKKKTAINFGSLIGHASIKRYLTHGENRDLTERELEAFKKIITKSFKEGALGVSLSFQFGYSRHTSKKELEMIAETVAEKNKVFALDLKDPENPEESVNEIYELSKKTNANIEINNLMPLMSSTSEYKKIKEDLEKKSSIQEINFDCQPYPYTKLSIHNLLPERFQKKNLKEMAELVCSGNHDEEIMEHLKIFSSKEIIIIYTPKEIKFLENKTIKEISKRWQENKSKTLLEIMKSSRLKAVCLLKNVNEKILKEMLFSNASLISSNGINLNPRYQPFFEFINLAQKNNNISFEKSLMKVTSLPAIKFGIKKRGVIKENYYADLLVIKNGEISNVIINGKAVFDRGAFKNNRAGEIIY
jgi:N-acyl-D-aspartate/D-glutamate deacylase